MDFDVDYLIKQIPSLGEGLLMTIQLSSLSIVLALLVGIVGAVIRMMHMPVLSQLTTAYVELVRNTPLLAQIFFIFYGLPAIGVKLSMFWSGVLTLVFWAGAYQIENLRGGLQSVTVHHRASGLALGLSKWDVVRLIALPLALRASVPSLLNTSVSLLKNSAFLQAVGIAELTYVAIDRIAMDFRTMEMLVALCVTYLVMILALSAFAGWLEHHLRKPFRT